MKIINLCTDNNPYKNRGAPRQKKNPVTEMEVYSKGWRNQVKEPPVAKATFIN